MLLRFFWSFVLLMVLWASLARGESHWVPFAMDWNKAGESAIDLSSFLEAPAGGQGFVEVRGKHLVKPDGTRFRIWGVNLCGPDCFPDKKDAPLLAGYLARWGFNGVRFHHLDSNWGRSIFDSSQDDTRRLDAENLDRLDFFIAELKKRGIYVNLNLNVLRRFKAGDGVRDYQLLGIGKSATYFNERLIELQQEYARQLLTHRNPYTGREYRHEPAVATVEMVNENSLLEGWAGWRLVGRNDKAGDTWSPIPVSYAEELTDLYNHWLVKNLSAERLSALRIESGVEGEGPVPRLAPNEFSKASKERFHAEATFYMQIEKQFFLGMKRLLKEELGVRSPLVGSADHNDGISGYPHLTANLVFDIVDGHGYWEHPNIGKTTWIKNTPMVNDPLDSTVTQFARSPVAGRPFTISEVNHPFPHEYACEGFPILTAYALLHDWDGIYWFTFGNVQAADPKKGLRHWFDFSSDPVKMANLAACALTWYRKDVKSAQETVLRSYTSEQVIESLRMDRKERPFFTEGFARSTPLQRKTRFSLDGSPASPFPPSAPLDRIESETGELGWFGAERKKGLVTVDTECTQALIGFVKENGRPLSILSANIQNEFCSIWLTSLDGKPIKASRRLLLTATARATNTGIQWKEDHQTMTDWGRGPVLIEPVQGEIFLKNMSNGQPVHAHPLSPEGRLLEDNLPVEKAREGWKITWGRPATTWCLIEVEEE